MSEGEGKVMVERRRAEAGSGVVAAPPLRPAAFRSDVRDGRRARAAAGRAATGEGEGGAADGASGTTEATTRPAAVRVSLPGVVGLLVLRADPGRVPLAAACRDALGLALPGPLDSIATGDRCLRWMSPDEWLLSCPAADTLALERALRDALDGGGAITEVTGGYCVLRLEGPGVRELLARSTTLDVDPRAFPPGRVANSTFARATATIRRIEGDVHELVVRRSFADYVARWIAEATREGGLEVLVEH